MSRDHIIINTGVRDQDYPSGPRFLPEVVLFYNLTYSWMNNGLIMFMFSFFSRLSSFNFVILSIYNYSIILCLLVGFV